MSRRSLLRTCMWLGVLLTGQAVAQQFQLNASLTADDGAGLSVGDNVTLTLTVSNAGPNGGSGRAAVQIPSVFSFQGASCLQTEVQGASGGYFEFDWTSIPDSGGQLAPNQSVGCDILLKLVSPPSGSVVATATILPTTFDPNPGNANYVFNINTQPTTDLAITASASPSTLTQGQTTTVHVVASNLGNNSAANTEVDLVFPESFTQFVGANCSVTTGNGLLVWKLNTFSASASESCDFDFQATTSSTKPVSLMAEIYTDTEDTNSSNNVAPVSLTINPPVLVDLAVALVANGGLQSYRLNDPVSLGLTVSAVTAAVAPADVVVQLKLPSAGLLAGLSASCGKVDGTGQSLTWNVSGLAVGAPQTCTVSGSVARASSPIAISATVAGAQTDPVLSNNSSSLVLQTYSPPIALVSTPTTKNSTNTALSSSGSVAVFESLQTDLVAGGVNPNGQDIFRFSGGQLVRENFGSNGQQLVGTSSLPAVSADGKTVVFQYSNKTVSASTSSGSGTKGASDQLGFIYGGQSGGNKHQVDMGMGGSTPNGSSGGASVSSDGHQAVFCSTSSNLVAGDTNANSDIFLADPLDPSKPLQRVSTDSDGQQLPGASCDAKISANGRKVVFTTTAVNLFGTSAKQVVRKDLVTNKLELISASVAGGNKGGNGDSTQPTIDNNGSTIAFVSKASDLDNVGPAAGGNEIFVSSAPDGNDGTQRTVLRARGPDMAAPNGASRNPALSCDGSTVLFESSASNLPGAQANQQGLFVFSPSTSSVTATGNTGAVNNNNPSVSCDNGTVGFDSNPMQSNGSTNSNVFSQSTPTLALDAGYSGQWDDPTQVPSGPGHGIVLDVIGPATARNLVLTWFAFKNGQPTWVQGISDPPQLGTGADAGMLVVKFNQVAIAKGKSFPLGEAQRTFEIWGSITLKFASSKTGTMTWTTSYPGFNSGSMQLSHFSSTDLPVADPPNAQVRACYAGNWFNPSEVGHGFELNVATVGNSRLLVVDWFAFDPTGNPVWLAGTGAIGAGNTVTADLYLITGAGAQFPPLFDHTKLTYLPAWGTATFTFKDSTHAHLTWSSTVDGYGSGQRDLQPVFGLSGRQCD